MWSGQVALFLQVRLEFSNTDIGAIPCLLGLMHTDQYSPTLWKAWNMDSSTVGVGFNLEQESGVVDYVLQQAGLEYHDQTFCGH